MYINLHSHYSEPLPGHVRNIIVRDRAEVAAALAEANNDTWLSAGIHPWYIDSDNTDNQLKLFSETVKDERVKLIGECGLDRLRGPAPEIQFRLFESQLKVAEALHKPVVIHCVKYFSELISLKKRKNIKIPMIVHGFNNNFHIAEQLLKHGFYFSFGPALLKHGSNATRIIPGIPQNRIFLETDDEHIPVSLIYESAASLLKISVNSLKEIIFATYLDLFGKK